MVNECVLEEKRWDYDSKEQGLTGDAREIRGERMSERDRIYVIITRILVKGTCYGSIMEKSSCYGGKCCDSTTIL